MYHKEKPVNFFTVEEFSKQIKVHPGTLRKLIKTGKIYAIRVGVGKKAPYRIPESELERLHLQSMCEIKK